MHILVTGSSGLVGSAVAKHFSAAGHHIIPLIRSNDPQPHRPWTWNPRQKWVHLDPEIHLDAVIHLAGKNIASSRWTQSIKTKIRESRVQGTQSLAQALAILPHPPKVLIGASGINFYGDGGKNWLDESNPAGSGFLAEVVQAWEAATHPAAEAGIRVVCTRFGMILSHKGGALAPMKSIFRFGVGGPLGSGNQFWSWVDLDDVVHAIAFALENDSLTGPVNVTSPNPVTNREFTRTLAGELHRPAWLPVPAFAVQILMGEMGRELLLSSLRVRPKILQSAGYHFHFPDLQAALHHQLNA